MPEMAALVRWEVWVCVAPDPRCPVLGTAWQPTPFCGLLNPCHAFFPPSLDVKGEGWVAQEMERLGGAGGLCVLRVLQANPRKPISLVKSSKNRDGERQ